MSFRDPLIGVRLPPGLLAALDAEVGRRSWRGRGRDGGRSRSAVVREALCLLLEVDRHGGQQGRGALARRQRRSD